MGDIVVAILTVLVILGSPVLWRVSVDRAAGHASGVRADVDRAVRSALGGESLVSVEVRPAGLTHRGQVILSAPAGWEELIEKSWPDVVRHVPDRYDLVIRVGVHHEAEAA